MIKSKLSVLMGIKNVNIMDVHRATGINRNSISYLKNNDFKRVDTETLSKLCDYFNCGVGDILEYERE